MITLDRDKPFGTISGTTNNNARFNQTQEGILYEFRADGEVIGDKSKLASDQIKKREADAQAKLDTAKAELAELEASAKAEIAELAKSAADLKVSKPPKAPAAPKAPTKA